MDVKEIYNQLEKEIPLSNIKVNEEMKKHTSFKIGGCADILVIAQKVDEIKHVLKIAKEFNVPLTIIGNGTNILVKDNGIRGIVLKIDLQNIEIQKEKQDVEMQVCYDKVAEEEEVYNYKNVIVDVGAGVKLALLAQKLLKEEIEGIAIAKREHRYQGRKRIQPPEGFGLLYEKYQAHKITKAEIARQLNISRPTVDRLITEKEKEQT